VVAVHAGTHEPVLPEGRHTQGPAGSQTIGCDGAASPIVAQSESVAQGFGGV
jgi:hypothetical protein